MAAAKALEPLRKALSDVLKYFESNLETRPGWGDLTFSEASLDFRRIQGMATQLSLMPLEFLTDTSVSQITASLNECSNILKPIDQFKIVDNAVSQRANLIAQIHGAAESLATSAAPQIPFLAYQRGDVAANIERLSSSVQEAQRLVSEAKAQIESELTEINKVSAEARAAAAKAGAAHFTKDFGDESKRNKATAKLWLIATAVFATLTIVVSLVSLLVALNNPNLTNTQLVQIVVAKLIVLSVLFSATVWCGKLYKASLHQAAINNHRALSLVTFTAFTAAASDEQTKNAVLLETTRAIFGQSTTGLLDDHSGPDDQSLKIVEIFKAIGQK